MEAMKAIEEYKPELEGVLPKDEYFRLTRDEKTKNIPNQLPKAFRTFQRISAATSSGKSTNTSSLNSPVAKARSAGSAAGSAISCQALKLYR